MAVKVVKKKLHFYLIDLQKKKVKFQFNYIRCFNFLFFKLRKNFELYTRALDRPFFMREKTRDLVLKCNDVLIELAFSDDEKESL